MASTSKTQKIKKQKDKEFSIDGLVVLFGILAGTLLLLGIFAIGNTHFFSFDYDSAAAVQSGEASTTATSSVASVPVPTVPTLDKEAYARKLLFLANNGLLAKLHATTSTTTIVKVATTSTSAATTTRVTKIIPPLTAVELVASTTKLWPAKAVYPNVGALLPFNRIVAYYGNFYSTQMGVLGQYPADEMLQHLNDAVQQWEAADPETPVIPAIDYIAMTAQGSPGADGMYRFRMPKDQIDHAIDLANQEHGIVILEVQAGLSNLQTEIESLEPYLILPQVHLAIDPEFHMTNGEKPGTVIGTVDASEVNEAAQYLASLVKEHNLPPKILIVHRFTVPMVTNVEKIKPLPEVQIVMDMDGWGDPAKKFGTYSRVIEPDPVQFTGFKLFYKNDLKPPSTHMLTPPEVLKLSPQPSFIQYQ